ncbi:hypothetical protein I3843_09G220400 [Carya illinoinensis]|nr:hypothetical protein I3843_09G220400 [Carya illinoinensis]
MHEENALWRNILDVKYGSIWGGWCTKEVRGAYRVGVWKFIRNGWNDFLGNCKYEMGRGTQISFWHDIWCGDVALKSAFPSLYRIALDPDSSVAENMCSTAEPIHWFVSFTRVAQDWEVGDIIDFYNMLYALKHRARREDRLLWTCTGNKKFSVRSY